MSEETTSRTVPNPMSKLLRQAVIGGAGIALPPDMAPPAGKAMVLLYVPIGELASLAITDIQSDLGIPWSDQDGNPVWLDTECH